MSFNKQDLRVGAPLAFAPHLGGSRFDSPPSYSFGWTVERLTPTGKGVAVRQRTRADGLTEADRRTFQHQGYETVAINGAVMGYGGNFHTDVEACQARVDEFRRRQEATAALNAVKLAQPARWTWGKDTMLAEVADLEALLAKARAAVEAI